MEDYAIVFDFILLEIIVIAAFVLLTYMFRYFFYFKSDQETKLQSVTIDFLKKQIEKNEISPLPSVKHLYGIIKAIEIIDGKYHSNQNWIRVKCAVMSKQILPIARKYINHSDWFKHFILLKCYHIHMEPMDEDNIIKLIHSRLPILITFAIKIGATLAKVNVYKNIIYKLSNEQRQFQIMNISQLDNSSELQQAIWDILQNENRFEVRQVCYRIIRYTEAKSEYFAIALTDALSNNINLQISAIQILAITNTVKAMPVYFELFKHEDWSIRNAVVRGLTNIKNPQCFLLLTHALKDPAWWVKTNAAKILSASTEGKEILNKQTGITYFEAEYFLTIRQLKEE